MRRINLAVAVVTLLAAQFCAQQAFAVMLEFKGNRPLSEGNYRDWRGIMPLVNDPTRVYQVWVNGSESFYYRGSVKQLNAELLVFSKLEVKNHVVALRPGPAEEHSFDKTAIPYKWKLHLMGGIAKHGLTDDIEDLERQKDPVLTIYIGGDIDLDKIEFPAGVTLRAAPGEKPDAKDSQALQKKIEEFVKKRDEGKGK